MRADIYCRTSKVGRRLDGDIRRSLGSAVSVSLAGMSTKSGNLSAFREPQEGLGMRRRARYHVGGWPTALLPGGHKLERCGCSRVIARSWLRPSTFGRLEGYLDRRPSTSPAQSECEIPKGRPTPSVIVCPIKTHLSDGYWRTSIVNSLLFPRPMSWPVISPTLPSQEPVPKMIGAL